MAELVASVLSRAYPDPRTNEELGEIAKAYEGLKNNIPGLLEEMRIGTGGQKIALKDVPAWIDRDVGFLRVDGPIVMHNMRLFSAKMGLALYFEKAGSALPRSGAILPLWFTNVQRLRGEIPSALLRAFPELSTLEQGRKNVSDQFEYGCRPDVGLYFAAFRQSFAVASLVATYAEELKDRGTDDWPVLSPPIVPHNE